MSRLGIQVVFILLTLLWFGYAALTFLGSVMGDCFDARLCDELKNTSVRLVFWRWLAGCFVLFGAYRFFRKDPDV